MPHFHPSACLLACRNRSRDDQGGMAATMAVEIGDVHVRLCEYDAARGEAVAEARQEVGKMHLRDEADHKQSGIPGW